MMSSFRVAVAAAPLLLIVDGPGSCAHKSSGTRKPFSNEYACMRDPPGMGVPWIASGGGGAASHIVESRGGV
jgi:hypothetical protein